MEQTRYVAEIDNSINFVHVPLVGPPPELKLDLTGEWDWYMTHASILVTQYFAPHPIYSCDEAQFTNGQPPQEPNAHPINHLKKPIHYDPAIHGSHMDVIALAINGDQNPLAEYIFYQCGPMIKRFAGARINLLTVSDADDILQAVVLKALGAINTYKDANFYGWLLRITTNHIKDTILKEVIRRPLIVPEEMDSFDFPVEEDGFDLIECDVPIKKVREAILKLPNQKRKWMVFLRYFYDLDYKEIADILTLPIGTVKSTLSTERLLNPLSKLLDPESYNL